MGTKPRRAEGSEGRTMTRGTGPLWYEGLGRYRRAAGPRLGRPAGSSGRAARCNRIGGTE